MAKKTGKKEDTHDSHNHAEHDHSHEGHDHEGHSCGHEHSHDGHDHADHDHEGHDHSHEGHDHPMPHTKVMPRKANTSGFAEDGNVVLIHYTGTLASGETFDSSAGRDPIEFVLGEHTVIKGFENGVRGMKKGEKKKLVIESKDAYGDVNPEMRQDVPREAMGDLDVKEGMLLALNHPMAPQPIPVKVIKVTPESVTIDMNHPLAGETLHFEIELVDIK